MCVCVCLRAARVCCVCEGKPRVLCEEEEEEGGGEERREEKNKMASAQEVAQKKASDALERAEADLGGAETVSETIGQVFAGYQCGTLQVRARMLFHASLSSPKKNKKK